MVTTRLRTACDLGRLLWRYDALAGVDVFTKVDVYGDELAAQDRLSRGSEEARSSSGTRETRYVDLSRRAS